MTMNGKELTPMITDEPTNPTETTETTEPKRGRPKKVSSLDYSEPEKVKEGLAELKNDFASETEKKERKKREPKNTVNPEEEAKKQAFKESINGVGSFAMNLIISRMPDKTPLSEMESIQFNKAFELVAMKYSDLLGSYSAEASLLMVGAMIVIPRLKLGEPKTDKSKNDGTIPKE